MTDDPKYNITLTDAATKAVKAQMEKRGTPNAYLRLGISGSGCNGYKYVLQYEDTPARTNDIQFDFDGLKVLVDPKSIIYLNGAKLDYENGLMRRGFVFHNQNEISRCGCGASINFEVPAPKKSLPILPKEETEK